MSKDVELRERAETIRRLHAEVERLEGLLSGRAGKLLLKRKPFIVVANDEAYFTAVYLVFRATEEAEGTWTEECQRQFQELTNYDGNDASYFPLPSSELNAMIAQQRDRQKDKAEVERLQRELASLKLQYDRETAESDRRCEHIVAMQVAAAAVLDWWEDEDGGELEPIMNNLRIAAKRQTQTPEVNDGP